MITRKDENVRLHQPELQPWAVCMQSNSVHEQCNNAHHKQHIYNLNIYWLYNYSPIIATVNKIPFNIVIIRKIIKKEEMTHVKLKKRARDCLNVERGDKWERSLKHLWLF